MPTPVLKHVGSTVARAQSGNRTRFGVRDILGLSTAASLCVPPSRLVPSEFTPATSLCDGSRILAGEPWEERHVRNFYWLRLGLVAVGLVWRLTRYSLRFPIWGDEAMLLMNYLRMHRYRDLFGPIDNGQIAPLLYHAAELTVLRWLGSSELAMRLPSLIACFASLLLFCLLARITLPPLGRTLAVGIFAVSIWPVTMGSLCKPYAFDLCLSLALLLPAFMWLQRPQQRWPLAVLVLVTPLAITGSYPSVFIAGALWLLLLPAVGRSSLSSVRGLFVLYTALLVGTFAAHYLLVARVHLASPANGVTAQVGVERYWEQAFPPPQPLAFLWWLILAHTGQVAAYPLGSANGGSIVTVTLATIGGVWFWRRGSRSLVLVTVFTFALWLIAAAMHAYPYAASCRLSQHVAPLFCLLAGMGTAVLILRLPTAIQRWRATVLASGLLALIGLGGTVRDILRPYRDDDARWARQVVGELLQRAGSDPVLVTNSKESQQGMDACFHWQLGRLGQRIRWAETPSERSLGATDHSLWTIAAPGPPEDSAACEARLAASDPPWRRVEQTVPRLGGDVPRENPPLFCTIAHWVRP